MLKTIIILVALKKMIRVCPQSQCRYQWATTPNKIDNLLSDLLTKTF
jgi:hypothetical protein